MKQQDYPGVPSGPSKTADANCAAVQLAVEIDGIIEWLRLKVREAGLQGLVLGVSGGIDSAVTAALAVRAFPDASLGMILPCKSSGEDVADAHQVCDALGIRKLELNLDEPHQSILTAAIQGLGGFAADERLISNARLTDANLRARLRMGALYTVANFRQYLVVGTDNAAEVYTGYFTKYGDGGVDLLPLSQFTKREVRALARVLGIPARIIAKAPSAGLWAGQTDEAELGVTYAEIDDYLEGKPLAPEARALIERRHQSSEHKRQLPAVYERNCRRSRA